MMNSMITRSIVMTIAGLVGRRPRHTEPVTYTVTIIPAFTPFHGTSTPLPR